ncbi:MAG TPA: hypothetical protein VFO01_03475 [Trebonia sp.]|nr:hypothetical protein [Trebonia sp.]
MARSITDPLAPLRRDPRHGRIFSDLGRTLSPIVKTQTSPSR